jgi:hypothetical protein
MVNADPIEIIWVILTGSALWQLWSKYPRMKGNIAYQQETALRDKSKPLARARINQAKSRFISRQISLVAVFIMFFLGIVALINPNASGPSVAKTIYAVVFIFLANFINNRASEVNDLWDRIDDDINDHIAGLTVNGVVKVAKVENSGTA